MNKRDAGDRQEWLKLMKKGMERGDCDNSTQGEGRSKSRKVNLWWR